MSKTNSRERNARNHKPQPLKSDNSIEKIEENLGIIANVMKNNTVEERDYNLQKKIFLCSILGALVGGLLTIIGVVVSNQANVLMKKNAAPFFQLNAIEKNGETTAYEIVNTGGQIQSVSIMLRNYIEIFDRYYSQDHYCFPFAEVTKTFAGQDKDSFLIDFTDTYFGIEKWTKEYGITNLLIDRLNQANIGANVSYLETMEIQYIDAARNVVVEFYVIKEDESGKLKLYLMTSEYLEEIKSLIPEGCDFKFREDDELCRELGSTGSSGGGRGSDPTEIFCQSIVDKLKEEISRKTTVTFD